MEQVFFTGPERQEILRQYFSAYRRWQDLDYHLAVARGQVPDALSNEKEALGRTLMDLRDRYLAGLPILPVSRCPFSLQVVYHSFDPYGIDGLWWNYDVPVRPLENLPPTFHAITGAVFLNAVPDTVPFLRVPGPAAPYVIPGILGNDHLKAVISPLSVGSSAAYAVTYFADRKQVPVPRVDTWGTGSWEIVDRDGTYQWGEGRVAPGDVTFDLGGWVEQEKLLWIAPGDRTFSLRKGTAGCPYLALPGTRQFQRIPDNFVREEGRYEQGG